jgi:hypothetical protein
LKLEENAAFGQNKLIVAISSEVKIILNISKSKTNFYWIDN